MLNDNLFRRHRHNSGCRVRVTSSERRCIRQRETKVATNLIVPVTTESKLANYTTAVNEKLTMMESHDFPWVMWYRSDASGDLPHVVAALKSQRALSVVVFDFGGSNKAQSILDKLEQHGIVNKRRLTSINFPNIGAGELGDLFKFLSKLTKKRKVMKYKILVDSTKLVVDGDVGISEDMKSSFRGPRGLTEKDKLFAEFWKSKGVSIDRPVVVLWGRWSGKHRKEMGPHPYGDSSTAGTVQIASKCIEQKWTPILAGDISKAKQDKFPPGCIFIGEFWNDPFWNAHPPTPSTMLQQVRLFYVLKKSLDRGNRLVHMGMRSGTLDFYGFSGQRVIYIIPEGIFDDRIQQLTKYKWWTQSRVNAPAKHAFAKWPPDLHQKLEQEGGSTWSNWKVSIKDSDAVVEDKKRIADYYKGEPLDIDTQLAIKLAYQLSKESPKTEFMTNAAKGLLQSPSREALVQNKPITALLDKERQNRGFSDDYLVKLIGQLEFALKGKPQSTSNNNAEATPENSKMESL